MYYALEMDLLGSQEGKTCAKITAQLVAENTEHTRAGAIALGGALRQDVLE
jgi:hypothetical protein